MSLLAAKSIGTAALLSNATKSAADFERNKHCLDVDKGKAKETTFHSLVEIWRAVFPMFTIWICHFLEQ